MKTATEQKTKAKTKTKKTAIERQRRERQEATAWLRLLSFLLLSGFRRVSASARKQKRQDRSKWPASRSEEVAEVKEPTVKRIKIEDEDQDKTLLAVQTVQFIYLLYIGLAIYTTRLSPRSAIILPLLRHRPPDGLALA